MNRYALAFVLAVTCTISKGQDISPAAVRSAQAAVLNRLIREADTAKPEELLRLSQTLSTLQAVEAGDDGLQVFRSIEPQLQYLPELVQGLQKQVMVEKTTAILKEASRGGMEPFARIAIEAWGRSLNLQDGVQKDIKAFEEESAVKKQLEAEEVTTLKATYRWLVFHEDFIVYIAIARLDGAALDPVVDAAIFDFFQVTQDEELEPDYDINGLTLDKFPAGTFRASIRTWRLDALRDGSLEQGDWYRNGPKRSVSLLPKK